MAEVSEARTRFRRLGVLVTATIKLLHIHHGPHSLTNTTQRKRKALVIGMNYAHNKDWMLKGPQTDVRVAEDLLLNVFHFQTQDIIVLSDHADNSLKPTRDNILEALANFVVDGEPDVDYIFIYSGHSDQFLAKGPSREGEEDEKAECIVPLDAIAADIDGPLKENAEPNEEKVIFDYELHRLLVKRLGKDSQLVAIFDSCHSATLLNLKHHKCNRLGRWTSAVRHVARRTLCDRYGFSLVRVPADHNTSGNLAALLPRYRIQRSGTYTSTSSSESQGLCTGLCCQLKASNRPRVFCISACKDREVVYEDWTRDGRSMLRFIMEYLRKNPTPTFRELMMTIHDNAKEMFDAVRILHEKEEEKKAKDCFLLKRLIQRAKSCREVKRWYPQISTTTPLNMDTKFIL